MSEEPKAFAGVSDHAKAVFATWFGMMSPGRGQLRFGMVESRPSDEAQAALDDLVSAELISQEGDRGAVIYRPLVDGRPMLGWLWPRQNEERFKLPLTALLTEKQPTGEIIVSVPRGCRKTA